MATGTTYLMKIGKKCSECSICRERYKQPKVLDCQHSFCQSCLEEYYSSKCQGAPKIPCPLCRQETVLPEGEVKGLKTNFHLIGLVEEIILQEKVASSGNKKVICEICDEGNEAVHYCLDCAQNICLNCRKMHLRIKVTSSHAVATFEDIHQGKVEVKKTPSKCQKHKGEVARFYCESCDMLVCGDCTVVDHQQHHYSDSGEASRKHRQSLKDAFTSFNKDINALETSSDAAAQAQGTFTKKLTETMEEVQANAAKIRAEVTIQEKKIIDEMKHLQQDRYKTFDEHEKTVSTLLQRKQHSLETAKDATNTASDSDFLLHYPTIREDLKSLSSQHPPKFDSKLLYLRFIQGLGSRDINLGGMLDEPSTSEWKLYLQFGIGTEEKPFLLAGDVAVSQDGDEIAVTTEKQVVICSTEGSGFCYLQPRKGIIPLTTKTKSIASIHNRLIVVDCTKYVKMFDEDRKQAFQFLTVPQGEDGLTGVSPESVAVKTDGTIIVGDGERSVLTEHTTSGALIRTIPVKTKPYYLAVDSCNDRVVISDFNQVDIVYTMGAVGETLFTMEPTINGLPGNCRGICCDKTGIYIVVRTLGTRHIHHYNTDGQFLSCIIQGLNYSKGITFTPDGHLAVSDQFSVKVYHRV